MKEQDFFKRKLDFEKEANSGTKLERFAQENTSGQAQLQDSAKSSEYGLGVIEEDEKDQLCSIQ